MKITAVQPSYTSILLSKLINKILCNKFYWVVCTMNKKKSLFSAGDMKN